MIRHTISKLCSKDGLRFLSLSLMTISILIASAVSLYAVPIIGAFLPKDEVTLRVLQGNEVNGGSELWLADTNGWCELERSTDISSYFGNLEYRLAADFGYGYNFLVSYGNNIGSEIRIDRSPFFDGLCVYCHPSGAVIDVEYDNTSQQINTYSETAQIVPVSLAGNTYTVLLKSFLSILLFAFSYIVAYRLLPTFWRNHEDLSCYQDTQNRRNVSVDVIRTVAAFLVVFVHSFLESGYYNARLAGEKMWLLTFFRWIAVDCVPLFWCITGFLCIKRKDVKKTYCSLLPLLVFAWVVWTLRIVIFDGLVWKTGLSLDYVKGIMLRMDLSGFLRLYIGIVLLMPFLNRLWSVLSGGEKKGLITVLLLLTAGRSAFGDYYPAAWIALYPITYYYIGAFLKEHPITLEKWKTSLLFLGVTLAQTLVTFYNGAEIYSWTMFGGYDCEYPSLPVIASTVLLFSFLLRTRVQNNSLAKFFTVCGKNTLGTYLISVSITDTIIHRPLQRVFSSAQAYMLVQLPAALASYFLSLAISVAINHVIQVLAFNRKPTKTGES